MRSQQGNRRYKEENRNFRTQNYSTCNKKLDRLNNRMKKTEEIISELKAIQITPSEQRRDNKLEKK